jgi:hypothetical protein
MHRTIVLIASCILAILSAGPAHAAILSVSGAMTILTPPADVSAEGITESSSLIFIIDEGVSIVPPAPPTLLVNAFGAGPHDDSFPPGIALPPGMLLHSYLVHFDPDGGVVSLTGGVTFDPGEIIFGIQTHTPLLYSTDGPFGDPGVMYPGAFIATRAFDSLPGPADMVTIAGDLNSAIFALTAELAVDQARIFTIPVPEPSSAALLGVGAVLLGWIRRRRAPAMRVDAATTALS